jgi:hypothetical protein
MPSAAGPFQQPLSPMEFQIVGTYHNVTLGEGRPRHLQRRQPFALCFLPCATPQAMKKVRYTNFVGAPPVPQGRWEHFRDEFFITFDYQASVEMQHVKEVLVRRVLVDPDDEPADSFHDRSAVALYEGRDYALRRVQVRFNTCYKLVSSLSGGVPPIWVEAPEGWVHFGFQMAATPSQLLEDGTPSATPPPPPPPPRRRRAAADSATSAKAAATFRAFEGTGHKLNEKQGHKLNEKRASETEAECASEAGTYVSSVSVASSAAANAARVAATARCC